ncbi:UNVERIFIED_CONTAM: hypothetical protein GTU68_050731 [Idotea baltica]|nr:hypothetical protein [Idotea baltica]
MRWIFDQLFESHGTQLKDHVKVEQLDVIARHTWPDGSNLDLFADIETSAQAISTFAGAKEADGFRHFTQRAGEIFSTLDESFMRHHSPSLLGLTTHVGFRNPRQLWNIRPFANLYGELGRFFRDTRLRQLFARYATYSGSSPYLCPATLMLIAHAEQRGVWQISGGMQALASTIASLAERAGAKFHFGTCVKNITVRHGRATGVITSDGTKHEADSVIFCGDAAALQNGSLGQDCVGAIPGRAKARSLSALTVAMVAQADGFKLHHHNVFFGESRLVCA